MNKIQIARAQFSQYAAITDDNTFTALPDVAAFIAALPDAAPVATALTKELFMGSTLGTSSGAEPIPMGIYSLVSGADGRPELTGGTYAVDGSIERQAYTPLDGVAADAQPDYIKKGAKRAVYFKAKHNQTNVEFRLSASALQAAIKGSAAAEFNPSGMELTQTVKENQGGYKIPTVVLA